MRERWSACSIPALLVGALLAASCGDGKEPAAAAAVVFTVDTLRADQLAPYGGQHTHTPHFDRLAAESLLFERAYTQATRTHPALSSMFTGLTLPQHGVTGQEGRLAEGIQSVVEWIRGRGVATASFSANLCRLQELPQNVFSAGWDRTFCGVLDDPEDYRDQWEWDRTVVDAFLAWLPACQGPYLAWLHLMDPHGEHRPPPHLWDWENDPPADRFEQSRHYGGIEAARDFPDPQDLARLWALYRAQIDGVDEQLGRVLEALDRDPRSERTAFIYSSDHGEELFETWSRYAHGFSLTEGVLQVPLTVRAPGLEPGRYGAPVELLQVAPTLLGLFGVDAPYALAGNSLLGPGASRGYALSFAGDVTTTMRTATLRYWRRHSAHPHFLPADRAPWRVEAPWFEQRESLATYPHEGGLQPRWLDLDDPLAARALAALQREFRALEQALPATAGRMEELDDPELQRQLSSLGYAGY